MVCERVMRKVFTLRGRKVERSKVQVLVKILRESVSVNKRHV